MDGDRAGFQLLDIAHEVSPLLFRIAFVFVAETLHYKVPDSGPQNPIVHKVAFDQQFVPGGPGLKGMLSGRKTGSLLH
jgi:hypothetical protein